MGKKLLGLFDGQHRFLQKKKFFRRQKRAVKNRFIEIVTDVSSQGSDRFVVLWQERTLFLMRLLKSLLRWHDYNVFVTSTQCCQFSGVGILNFILCTQIFQILAYSQSHCRVFFNGLLNVGFNKFGIYWKKRNRPRSVERRKRIIAYRPS